jgi:hypothetical protein
MASVRASVVNQARMAASRLPLRADSGDAIDGGIVEQLLRCASLSPDPAHTLEWALDSLRAHPVGRADHLAYQLVRAARARLDTAAVSTRQPDERRRDVRSLAWA